MPFFSSVLSMPYRVFTSVTGRATAAQRRPLGLNLKNPTMPNLYATDWATRHAVRLEYSRHWDHFDARMELMRGGINLLNLQFVAKGLWKNTHRNRLNAKARFRTFLLGSPPKAETFNQQRTKRLFADRILMLHNLPSSDAVTQIRKFYFKITPTDKQEKCLFTRLYKDKTNYWRS